MEHRQNHQMCAAGADFKHFSRGKSLKIAPLPQRLVNHADQGLVNHAAKSLAGEIGLTSLFKPKRTCSG
jgi:hypothetical protein